MFSPFGYGMEKSYFSFAKFQLSILQFSDSSSILSHNSQKNWTETILLRQIIPHILLAYRTICFDFEIKTNNFMGIGVNFRTICKSKEEELLENLKKMKNRKSKIYDRNIAIFYVAPEQNKYLNCGMVRAHFRLPLKRFSAT